MNRRTWNLFFFFFNKRQNIRDNDKCNMLFNFSVTYKQTTYFSSENTHHEFCNDYVDFVIYARYVKRGIWCLKIVLFLFSVGINKEKKNDSFFIFGISLHRTSILASHFISLLEFVTGGGGMRGWIGHGVLCDRRKRIRGAREREFFIWEKNIGEMNADSLGAAHLIFHTSA